jgi:hypothetical protein
MKILILLLTMTALSCGTTNRNIASNTEPSSTKTRYQNRSFPSIFVPWASAENLNQSPAESVTPLSHVENAITTLARHDLIFKGPHGFGLQFNNSFEGLATGFTASSVAVALQTRASILSKNPNAILLAEIRYRDAASTYLPANSVWWMRDSNGKPVLGWKEGNYYLLDFTRADFQHQVALQCSAVIQTGVVDGCMFDWWAKEDASRLTLIKKVRDVIGPDALIIVNVNGRLPMQSAPYLNGIYMEGFGSSFFSDWHKASQNLIWARKHLQSPAITAFEGWGVRNDLLLMRMVTTLSLVFSDGYVLFSDPDSLPTPDHAHDWYAFWNRSLGKPSGASFITHADGSFSRDYENGMVVFNPPENQKVIVHLSSPGRSRATGVKSITHFIQPGDGDIFVRSE